MSFIEWFKTVAIRTTDTINKLNDPFDDFKRPAIGADPRKLSELEDDFYSDLVAHFWGCDGQVLLHRIPLPAGSPLDMGDQAIWHGIYTGVLAIKYHCETMGTGPGGDPMGSAYGDLLQAVKGLQLHQTVHGESLPRLIRGVSDDQQSWQDDASNDSLTGHLFGIYFAWKYGPTTLRPVLQTLAAGVGAELIGHGHAIVGPDGKPTTYGALVQGWQTDPLRVSLALATYAVCATITKSPAFMGAYSDLYSRYGGLACYPKAKLWWLDNQNDTHRAAIHLAILADLTMGQPHHQYVDGLDRIQDMTAKEGNVWVNALCQFGRGGSMLGRGEREIALKVLSEFRLRDKQYNPGVDNYPIGTPYAAAGIRAVKWGDTYRSSQPLPRYVVRAQDFFWQRNLRSLDVGSKGSPADSRLNGGDFLAAYWMSRLAGILDNSD